MMKFTSLLLLLLTLSFSVTSQINVDNSVSPETAVNEILTGIGIDAFNITFSGDSNQIGSFLANGSNISIGEGIVLGTGNVNMASGWEDPFNIPPPNPDDQGPGGNNNGGATVGGGNFGASDADLLILNISSIDTTFIDSILVDNEWIQVDSLQIDTFYVSSINDAAILEFDFIASGTELTFNFVFASEEYNEYVCGTVNDSFGFFLSGAGIEGGFEDDAVNLAQIPGTDPPVPVTINSVNNGNVGQFGTQINCDNITPDWQDYAEFYEDNSIETTDPNIIEYDGFTVSLTASSDLICDSVYHIKIAIGDGGDTAFDSAVFLEAGSFDSNAFQVLGTGAVAGTSIFQGDSIIVEGPNCNLAGFEFILPDTLVSDSTIFFNVLGTATNSLDPDIADFTYIPDSIIIQAGTNSATIQIGAFEDNIEEGFETVIIEYEYVTICLDTITSTTTMYIADYVEPTLSLEDFSSDCPEQFTLTSEVSGFGGFSYEWSDGSEESSLIVSPDETTVYTLTVTDICGEELTDSSTVTITDFPELIGTPIPGTSTCPGDPVTLSIDVVGGAPSYTYNWQGLSDEQTLTINPEITTDVTVFITDQCETIPVVVTATVIPWPGLDIVSLDGTSICPGEPVDIGVTVSGGFPGYTYQWSGGAFGNDATTTVSPLTDMDYTVTVTDQCDSQSATVNVDVDDLQQNIVVPYDTVICAGDTYAIESGLISGGLGIYSFSTFESPDSLALTAEGVYTGFQPGDYQVFVTDACPWVNTNVLDIQVEICDTFIPNVFSPDSDGEEGSVIGGLGLNERFFIIGLEKFPNSQLSIFNRWGVLVYEDTNYNNTWRGQTAAGNDLEDGVYFYVFRRSDGKEQTGSITLLRKQ